MVSWSIELSEFGIKYEPGGPIKAQYLADFVVELSEEKFLEEEVWIFYVDGTSNKKGSGAGIMLEGPGRFRVEQALIFEFKTSKDQVEYEALIAGLC